MSDDHTPTRKQVDDVLERFTPRQIATAYLRASRRAKSADSAFEMSMKLNDLMLLALSSLTGGADAAERAIAEAEKNTLH